MTDDKMVSNFTNIFPDIVYVIFTKDMKWCLTASGEISSIEDVLRHRCLPKIYKTRQIALNAIYKSWKLKPEVYGEFKVVGFNIKCEEIVDEERKLKILNFIKTS